jgi:hypothetical protein
MEITVIVILGVVIALVMLAKLPRDPLAAIWNSVRSRRSR